jgi:hypothetical protein
LGMRRMMPQIEHDAAGRRGRGDENHHRREDGGPERQPGEPGAGAPGAMGWSRSGGNEGAPRWRGSVTSPWRPGPGGSARVRRLLGSREPRGFPGPLGFPGQESRGRRVVSRGCLRCGGCGGISGPGRSGRTEWVIGSGRLRVVLGETTAAARAKRRSLLTRPSAIAADIHGALTTPSAARLARPTPCRRWWRVLPISAFEASSF